MPQDIGPKASKFSRKDIMTVVRINLRAVCWKDRRDVYVLTNMHSPSVEGNSTDETGHALTPRIIEDYSANKGFVD
jgi:hypothetical protein